MAQNIVAKVKDSIEKMPPLSPVVHKIIIVANDVTSSAQHLTDVIQLDPVLTAKVIRMVNSAYFGLPQEIKSLKQAVVMLGINTIKNVALSSALMGKIALKKGVLDPEEFWKHSIGVAVASKLIAQRLGIDKKLLEEFFIAGLIHDIGKVLMNNFFPDEMKQIIDISQSKGGLIIDIEKNILGLTHEEIGIAIGKKWNFENNLLYAVGRHHIPVLKGDSAIYSMVVHVADTFSKVLKVGFSGNYVIDTIDEAIWQTLGISEEIVFDALTPLSDEIQKAKLFLQ
ncbi:MAG: HDOD domain-containing protein [Spirochaetota bacterium]|jgi:putative nucleotidyltransferase with HDIG domain